MISPSTNLLSVTFDQAFRYFSVRDTGEYTDADVRFILERYFVTSAQVWMDPIIPIAQMSVETAHLTSPPSQRPRRNPAGIGITGPGVMGVSFDTWIEAVNAQIGRLLAYALPVNKGTAEQKRLISTALSVRPLPLSKRGSATTLEGLAGAWAADLEYAKTISRVANTILSS
jgi:hypothetical protein